jgi:hypothetical protein
MAATLDVIWIAPVNDALPQLAWLNELGRIANIPGVTMVTRTGNKISLDEVATALNSCADVMIWAGHGAPGGLVLSDGSMVRPLWLAAQVARGCKPRVAVLAACGSQHRDEALRSLTEAICRAGVNVVGFPAETDDGAAATFTVELVRALRTSSSIQAFEVALEAIRDSPTAEGVFFTPGVSDLTLPLELRLVAIEETLARIEKRLDGQTIRMDASTPDATPTQAAGGIRPLASASRGHIRPLRT